MEPAADIFRLRSPLLALTGWALAGLIAFRVPAPGVPILVGLLALARLAILARALRALFIWVRLIDPDRREMFQ